jgi:hypothetical protein
VLVPTRPRSRLARQPLFCWFFFMLLTCYASNHPHHATAARRARCKACCIGRYLLMRYTSSLHLVVLLLFSPAPSLHPDVVDFHLGSSACNAARLRACVLFLYGRRRAISKPVRVRFPRARALVSICTRRRALILHALARALSLCPPSLIFHRPRSYSTPAHVRLPRPPSSTVPPAHSPHAGARALSPRPSAPASTRDCCPCAGARSLCTRRRAPVLRGGRRSLSTAARACWTGPHALILHAPAALLVAPSQSISSYHLQHTIITALNLKGKSEISRSLDTSLKNTYQILLPLALRRSFAFHQCRHPRFSQAVLSSTPSHHRHLRRRIPTPQAAILTRMVRRNMAPRHRARTRTSRKALRRKTARPHHQLRASGRRVTSDRPLTRPRARCASRTRASRQSSRS